MAFTLFCREFGNVVNRALLVLIFWVKKLVGANFTRFCNYEVVEPKPDHLHVRILALSLLW